MMIIPAGQEVEMTGLYTFFSKVIGFAPGQFFAFCVDTKLGGEGSSRRIGWLGIVAFQFIGGMLTSTCLDEKGAREMAKKTEHLRVRSKEVVRGSKATTRVQDEA